MSAWILGAIAVGAYALGKAALNKLPAASPQTPATSIPPSNTSKPIPKIRAIDSFGNPTAPPTIPNASIPAPVNVDVMPAIRLTIPHMTPAEAIAEAMRTEGNDIDSRDVWFVSGPATYTNILNGVPSYVTPAQAQLIGKDPLSSTRPVPQQGLGKMTLVSTAAGLALGVTGLVAAHAVAAGATGLATGVSAAIPFIGIGIAGIVGIFGVIHAHHAAAVAQEQGIFYSINPAAFDYLRVIRGAVASGQASPQEAIHALDSLLADYKTQAAPSVKHNPCNANCEGVFRINAIVIYWKSYYTDMISQGATR
jgi:hypothetical protein